MTAPNETGSQGAPNGAANADAGVDTSNVNQGVSDATGAQEADTSQGDTVSRAEYEDVKRRMQAADQNRSRVEKEAAEAKQKLAEIERKDQSELERATTDLQAAKTEIETLVGKLNDQALENAFLTNNKYSWANSKDALRLLELEGVEVKDGQVTGLEPAIAKLAKDKPYLLKKDDGDTGGDGSSGASGSVTNGKRKGENPNDKKDYSGRFPALKR